MSILKVTASAAMAGMLIFSTSAFAQVGGGTELPSSAEPNKAKDPAEKAQDQAAMKKDGAMEKGSSMEKKDDKM